MAAAEVKSVATRRFWDLFNALPADVQDLAVKNYHTCGAMTRIILHSISAGPRNKWTIEFWFIRNRRLSAFIGGQ